MAAFSFTEPTVRINNTAKDAYDGAMPSKFRSGYEHITFIRNFGRYSIN